MSREYKFRVWNEVQRKMINNGELFALDCSNEIPFLPLAKGWYSEDEHGYCANYEIMQYTGLKDKNGKEIYEGDILRALDRLVIVQWNQYLCGFDSEFLKFIDEPDFNFRGIKPVDWYNLEVIGNVYEQPEMLESEE